MAIFNNNEAAIFFEHQSSYYRYRANDTVDVAFIKVHFTLITIDLFLKAVESVLTEPRFSSAGLASTPMSPNGALVVESARALTEWMKKSSNESLLVHFSKMLLLQLRTCFVQDIYMPSFLPPSLPSFLSSTLPRSLLPLSPSYVHVFNPPSLQERYAEMSRSIVLIIQLLQLHTVLSC